MDFTKSDKVRTSGCKYCDGTDHYSEACKFKKRKYEIKKCRWCRKSFQVENAWQNRTACCQGMMCFPKQKEFDKFFFRATSTMPKMQCVVCLEPRVKCRCR